MFVVINTLLIFIWLNLVGDTPHVPRESMTHADMDKVTPVSNLRVYIFYLCTSSVCCST